MLVLEVPAVICGVDNFAAVTLFGQFSAAGLLTVPELPYGIPSHNMPDRICARRNAARMKEGLRDGVQDTLAPTVGQWSLPPVLYDVSGFAVGQGNCLADGTRFAFA